MKGTYLILYIQEGRLHHGMLLHEWLLQQAHRLGLQGGTAFKAIAGYGRHGHIHADHFFELAGDLPVEVTFMAAEAEVETLLGLIQAEGISLFYVRMPAECGVMGELTRS